MKTNEQITASIYRMFKGKIMAYRTFHTPEIQTLMAVFRECFESDEERQQYMQENGWNEFYHEYINK
ncbi:MAG: hypothetical protein MJZ26_09260 [Fibrobacter sp.]|nr:hypothetical protein [Fibrobacter sp.]